MTRPSRFPDPQLPSTPWWFKAIAVLAVVVLAVAFLTLLGWAIDEIVSKVTR